MKHAKIYMMLVGFSLFTGATFNIAKYAVEFLTPASVAAWRFCIASLLMLIILIVTEGINFDQLKRNIGAYLALGIIGVFGFNALFFVGLKSTSAVNGALIMGLNPLLTTILARFILKSKVSTRQTIGIILAFIGVTLVITHGSIEMIKSLSISIGDFIILGGNICWALYGVLGRRFVKDGTPLSTTTYTMVIGTIGLAVYSIFTPSYRPIAEVPLQAWGSIVFMAVFTSVLGYLWWNKAMKEIGPSKTSLFFNLVPIVTMIISYILGIPVTFIQVMGVVVVLFGVLISAGEFRVFKLNVKGQSA